MNRRYNDEFKRQADKKVFDGQSMASVARQLGVGEGLIDKWKRAILESGDGERSGAEVREAAALKKRIGDLEMENEILKKGTLLFGRGS
jgi:transposase